MKNEFAIMIDVGGVLIDVKRPAIDGFDKYDDTIKSISKSDISIREELQIGSIGIDLFYDKLISASPGLSVQNINYFECAWLSPLRGDVVGAINSISGFDIFIGSNTHQIHWNFLEEAIFKEMDVSGVFLSFLEGVMKPENSFFSKFVNRHSGYKSYYILDDRRDNVVAAEENGFIGINFDNNNYEESLRRVAEVGKKYD